MRIAAAPTATITRIHKLSKNISIEWMKWISATACWLRRHRRRRTRGVEVENEGMENDGEEKVDEEVEVEEAELNDSAKNIIKSYCFLCELIHFHLRFFRATQIHDIRSELKFLPFSV